jgi:hypothetical protein
MNYSSLDAQDHEDCADACILKAPLGYSRTGMFLEGEIGLFPPTGDTGYKSSGRLPPCQLNIGRLSETCFSIQFMLDSGHSMLFRPQRIETVTGLIGDTLALPSISRFRTVKMLDYVDGELLMAFCP